MGVHDLEPCMPPPPELPRGHEVARSHKHAGASTTVFSRTRASSRSKLCITRPHPILIEEDPIALLKELDGLKTVPGPIMLGNSVNSSSIPSLTNKKRTRCSSSPSEPSTYNRRISVIEGPIVLPDCSPTPTTSGPRISTSLDDTPPSNTSSTTNHKRTALACPDAPTPKRAGVSSKPACHSNCPKTGWTISSYCELCHR